MKSSAVRSPGPEFLLLSVSVCDPTLSRRASPDLRQGISLDSPSDTFIPYVSKDSTWSTSSLPPALHHVSSGSALGHISGRNLPPALQASWPQLHQGWLRMRQVPPERSPHVGGEDGSRACLPMIRACAPKGAHWKRSVERNAKQKERGSQVAVLQQPRRRSTTCIPARCF